MNNLTTKLYESAVRDFSNEELQCICCGKKMKTGLVDWVMISEKWEVVNPNIVNAQNAKELVGAEIQAVYPVGSDCAKKMKGFTFKEILEKNN
jgi:hypothetical protein